MNEQGRPVRRSVRFASLVSLVLMAGLLATALGTPAPSSLTIEPQPVPELPDALSWVPQWLDHYDRSGSGVDDRAEARAREHMEAGRPEEGVSVILVLREPPTLEDTVRLVDRFGADPQSIHVLSVAPAIHATFPAHRVPELGAVPGVVAVEWDFPIYPMLATSAPATKAREFTGSPTSGQVYNGKTAEALGYTGTGTVIAVIDSGVQTTHPAFAGKLVAAADSSTAFTIECVNPDDVDGHGTHVASTALGNPTGNPHKGTAMDARLVDIQITKFIVSIGGIQRGLNWVHEYNQAIDSGNPKCGVSPQDRIDVATVSFGTGDRGGPNAGSTETAVDNLVTQGVVVTIAVGNCGPDPSILCDFGDEENGISSPGNAANAISVANVNHWGTVPRGDDVIAGSSSRGPNSAQCCTGDTNPGAAGGATDASDLADRHRKPDIAAPGTSIDAANAFHAAGSDYETMSGTSMSTPHVAGIAALLIQAGEEVKAETGDVNRMRPTGSSFDTNNDYINGTNPIRDALIYSAEYRTENVPPAMLDKWEGPNSAGAMWNNAWGYGAVDAFAAICWAWAHVLIPGGATATAQAVATKCGLVQEIEFTQNPATTTADDPVQFQAAAVDVTGNKWSGAIEYAIDTGPGSIDPQTGWYTPVSVGTAVINASVTIGDDAWWETTSIEVTHGAADHMDVACPGSVIVGVPFDCTVTILDGAGNVVTGHDGTIGFVTNATEAPDGDPYTLPPDHTINPNDEGEITITAGFVLVRAESYVTLTVEDPSDPLVSGTSDRIDVHAAPAHELRVVNGNNQAHTVTEALQDPFVVRVVDPFGNPVEGHAVSFEIAATPDQAQGQQLIDAAVTTDGDGEAATTLTLGDKAGPYEVNAAGQDLVGAPLVFTAHALPGPAVSFAVDCATDDPKTAGVPFACTVTALDEHLNVDTGYEGAVAFSTSAGTAPDGQSEPIKPLEASFQSNHEGVQSFDFTFVRAESGISITVTDAAPGTITGTDNGLEVVAGTASSFVFDCPGSKPAGSMLTPSNECSLSQWMDEFGNGASSRTVSYSAQDDQGNEIPKENDAFVMPTDASREVTVTASTDDEPVASETSAPVALVPADPTRIVAQGPGLLVAGETGTYTFTLQDDDGNVFAIQTESLTMEMTGEYEDAVCSTFGHATIQDECLDVTIVPAPASSFLVACGDPDKTAGVAFSCTLAVVDGFLNEVPDYEGEVSFSHNATMAPVLPGNPTFTQSDGGVMQFPDGFTLFRAEAGVSITATDVTDNTITGSSEPLRVEPGPASKLMFDDPPASMRAGASVALTLQRQDDYGNPVTSADPLQVDLETTSGAGTFQQEPETAKVTHVTIQQSESSISFLYNDTRAGQTWVNASAVASGLEDASLLLTVTPGPPVLASHGPTSHVVDPGEEMTLRVVIRDAHGNPVPAHAVTWETDASEGSLQDTQATTDPKGVASAGFTAGATNGATTSVTASATDDEGQPMQGSPVVFMITTTQPEDTETSKQQEDQEEDKQDHEKAQGAQDDASDGPGRVTDLRVDPTNTNNASIVLHWTAPHTQGDPVAGYQVAVSRSPITKDTFDDHVTTDVTFTPKPLAAPGTTQLATVTNLHPNTQYHFAVKAETAQGAQSEISNTATGRTTTFDPVTANMELQASVRVRPVESGMQVTWDANKVPNNAAGLLVWRINSPANFIKVITIHDTEFTTARFTDPNGTPTSGYLLTLYYGGEQHQGYNTQSLAEIAQFLGTTEDKLVTEWGVARSETAETTKNPIWTLALITLGLLVLVAAVAASWKHATRTRPRPTTNP